MQGGRQRGQPGLQPPVHDRRSSAAAAPNNKHAGRDNRGNRNTPLGPRHAGVQKVHGRPIRDQPPPDRHPRHSSGPGPNRIQPPAARHAPGPRRASYPPAMHTDRPPPVTISRGGGPAAPLHRGAGPPVVLQREYNAPPARIPVADARLPSSGRGPPPARGPAPNRMGPSPSQNGPVYALPPHMDPRSALSPELRQPSHTGLRNGPRQPQRAAPQTVPRVAAPRSREGYPTAQHAEHAPLSRIHDLPNGLPQYDAPPMGQPDQAPRRGAPAGQRQPAAHTQRGSERQGPGANPRAGTPRGTGPRADHRQQPSMTTGNRAGPQRGAALAGSPGQGHRQQQQPPKSRYQSPLTPPAQLPTPRMGPPVGPPRDNTPRVNTPRGGQRNSREPLQHDRPRSQSRGRQAPAASAYPHDQHAPQPYARSNLGPVEPPVLYEPAPYASDPHADPYGSGPSNRGPPQQQWGPEGSQSMDYQQGPPTQQVTTMLRRGFWTRYGLYACG